MKLGIAQATLSVVGGVLGVSEGKRRPAQPRPRRGGREADSRQQSRQCKRRYILHAALIGMGENEISLFLVAAPDANHECYNTAAM